jgi:SAM-dependent methyltransferase
LNVEEYEKMYSLEGSYWWFQGRMRLIQSVLKTFLPEPPRPGRVLDVGCGTGLMMQEVKGWRPTGVDFSMLALQFCRDRGLANLAHADVVNLPFQDGSLDLILALDMMEHVERDDLLIREFNRVLRPGGCIMATVPAHPYLWSDHDVALHHFRRYTWSSMRSLLKSAKFRPIKFSYGICLVHPLIVVFRMLQRLWQRSTGVDNPQPKTHLIALPSIVNSFLIGLLRIEARLIRVMNLPFGTSLVVLARKEAELPRASRTA